MDPKQEVCLSAPDLLRYLDGELPDGRKAELDRHLENADADDLGAPPYSARLELGTNSRDAYSAGYHAGGIGLRDRSAFDARSFDGLGEGIAKLG